MWDSCFNTKNQQWGIWGLKNTNIHFRKKKKKKKKKKKSDEKVFYSAWLLVKKISRRPEVLLLLEYFWRDILTFSCNFNQHESINNSAWEIHVE